uniref:Uncharacterized protein n=1 Tax=Helianthus annuus TaxID=4232 RepID=A0A251SXB9_HELAN
MCSSIYIFWWQNCTFCRSCNELALNKTVQYGWKPVDAEIQKKGVLEEAPIIVCRPIISRIPCIN